MVSVGQQVSIELPEVLGALLQEVAMGEEAWRQFPVMAIFMDPAQGQLDGQPVELGRIITQKQFDHWVGDLGSVGRDRQGFLHALAQSGPIFGQVRIQHVVKLVFRVRLVVGQQRGKRATPLLRDAQRQPCQMSTDPTGHGLPVLQDVIRSGMSVIHLLVIASLIFSRGL